MGCDRIYQQPRLVLNNGIEAEYSVTEHFVQVKVLLSQMCIHVEVFPPLSAQCPWGGFNGKQWSEYQRIAILHHLRQATAPRHEVHCVWKVSDPTACLLIIVCEGSEYFRARAMQIQKLLVLKLFKVLDVYM